MDIQQQLSRLGDESAALGVDTGAVRALAGAAPDYATALPVLSDLRDALSDRPAASDLRAEVDAIIGELQRAEQGASAEQQADADVLPRATFDDLKPGYLQLFSTCAVRPEYAGRVAWHVRKLADGQPAYQRIAVRTGIPWYFIGIAHGLEASFRFSGHLHNGDPLTVRTVNVPKGRPPVWNPPTDWDSSAMDALAFEGFTGKTDWSLARMLYRWEAYNGFGTRARGINTPYLWSFSTHYARGKYASDGHWDPNLLSKQCGAAVMLHALIDAGRVPPLPPS